MNEIITVLSVELSHTKILFPSVRSVCENGKGIQTLTINLPSDIKSLLTTDLH